LKNSIYSCDVVVRAGSSRPDPGLKTLLGVCNIKTVVIKTLVASPADRATGQGALSPCPAGITSVHGWSNNGANLDFWRENESALSAGHWSHLHRVDFWNDSSESFHRLWMGTLRWVTPRDKQLFPSKTIHFHRNYVTDRDGQGGRAKFRSSTLVLSTASDGIGTLNHPHPCRDAECINLVTGSGVHL
jgi:hypothetical protein